MDELGSFSMDGAGGRAPGSGMDHTSDSPSGRLRRRVNFSAPMPSSFDARRSSNDDMAVVVASRPRLVKQTTGFSSNTVVSSSSSGTIVSISTTNTSTSSGSSLHMYLFDDGDEGIHILKPCEETEKKRMNSIKSLVQEFFGASSSSSSSSTNCTAIDSGGDMSVLERWFTELGVDWVLHISDGDASVAGTQPDDTFDPQSWIRALNEIIETIHLTTFFFSDDRGFVGMPSICEEEEEEEDFFRKSGREDLSNYIIKREKCQYQIQKEEKADKDENCIPDQLQFARFIQKTMLKMLVFVDFLVALDPNSICEFSVGSASGIGMPAPALYQKMSILLCVLDPLSDALFEIEMLLLSMPSADVKTIRGEMLNLLYAKDNKAAQAVWSTMEEIWARIMESIEVEDGQDCVTTTHGSADIHRVTLYVTSHIRYLWANYWSVTSIVFSSLSKQHVTETTGDTANPLARLTTEMVSCLEEKLAKRSQSFEDQGLRYLFLINNSTYILQELQTTYGCNFLHSYFMAFNRKIDDYIQAYLQLCWAPVLSCLFNPTAHCFGKSYYSPLPKFEKEFQKIYTTQKLWKILDPELRKTMRDAITTKIIPGYTRYIEDNEVSTTKFTPQNLQEMLQELFEG